MEGGFDAKFVSLPNNLTCPICQVGMRDPVQTACGHRFCTACVQPLQTPNRSLTCPVCRQELEPNQVFPDVAVKREVLDLEVRCDLDGEGCNWKGELRALEDHTAECQFVTVPCSLSCGANIMRRRMSKHLRAECCRRKVACKHCKNSFQFQNMKKHEAECPQMPLRCPQDCGKILFRSKIKRHVANDGTCPNTTLECPFEDAGCEFVGKRKDMAQHKKEEIENHLTMTYKKMTDLKDEIAELKQRDSCWKEGLDSVFLWKVADWAKNFDKAKTEECHDIKSPEVYISVPGHKVALTVCPNDRMSGNVGIYLSIAQGEYDSFIKWPFNWDFSFILIDQQINGENKTKKVAACENMKAALNQDTFSSYGCSQFISHDELEQRMFVRNDCLFVKLVVHMY
ncbi:TNF receptor-associated factor 4-like [Oscarella lobularis]|uniref:TNF receptor-associated factor 4-like n=1 Tax=Oscarella lobularis TaxID=121494 RepID=UPI003313D769